MQFYVDGYRSGDPEIVPAAPNRRTPGEIPAEVDVLVVGTGPAGTVLSAQLAEFPEINTLVVERREGPLEKGHADGVACRTVEMFNAFGLAEKLMREAYWVNETTFWGPAEDAQGIRRTGRIDDVEEGLSEYPHVIVNQARTQQYLLDNMANSASKLVPEYGMEFVDLTVAAGGEFPVTARLKRGDEEFSVNARYVVGCDGAHSAVRKSMGISLNGDAKNHAWGVMDVLAVTDFPDIRLKSIIQSPNGGSIVLIPREGGFLVRLYVDLGDLDPHDRDARSRFTLDHIIASAQEILAPYTLDVRDVAWWSVYEVGQRVADRFDNVPSEQRGTVIPRVFIAGDACHTHSAKAGQGMNVSMQDGFNLGWKLAAVLRGEAAPSLLDTYNGERQPIAQELIDFDTKWSSAMAEKPRDPEHPELGGMDASERQEIFQQGGRFTAGFATVYPPSLLIGDATYQHLATGFPLGERFYSAPVVRVADAKPVELGHEARADGRWRLYAFADAAPLSSPDSRLATLCRFLEIEYDDARLRSSAGSSLDFRAVLQQPHREVDVTSLPSALKPRVGKFGLVDYEKVYSPNLRAGRDIFAERGIDIQQGALVIVRPDQYVAHVLPLDATDELASFFARFSA